MTGKMLSRRKRVYEIIAVDFPLRRGSNVIIPNRDLILKEGDSIIVYTLGHLCGAVNIEV